jgi:glycine/D-amino acid oxidase-like deaminating enzyme
MDVVVIGAGISGAASAYELARAGLKVALVDRYTPAAMASGWTLAGVRQSGRHPAELPLAQAAVALWPSLGEELGADTHYRRDGNLRLARTESELPIIERLVAEQSAAGLPMTYLRGATEIGSVTSAVAENVLAASFCATDGHADPNATVNAYVQAAHRAGADLRFGERAHAIETRGNCVAAVRTDRETISAGAVVVAAGVFGNQLLRPLGLEVPLHVHEVTVLRSAPTAPVLRPVIGVANADCAGRQEVDGRFRATSGILPWGGDYSDENRRPTVRPSAASVADVVEKFGAAVPAFRHSRIESVWAGLIDLTPDALPVLDAPDPIPGLAVAMGFSGHGFCLGPVTGQIMAALVQGHAPSLPIAPFRLARFAVRPTHAEPVTLHG